VCRPLLYLYKRKCDQVFHLKMLRLMEVLAGIN
jgi:hypothetical protein